MDAGHSTSFNLFILTAFTMQYQNKAESHEKVKRKLHIDYDDRTNIYV